MKRRRKKLIQSLRQFGLTVYLTSSDRACGDCQTIHNFAFRACHALGQREVCSDQGVIGANKYNVQEPINLWASVTLNSSNEWQFLSS